MNYTDIDSHETACRVLGKDPKLSTSIHDQLDDIAKAINKLDGDFIANFNNPRQKKWRPLFIVDASGFRFVSSGCVGSYSYASVGSRLCQFFSSRESSDFYATKFLDLHKKVWYRE